MSQFVIGIILFDKKNFHDSCNLHAIFFRMNWIFLIFYILSMTWSEPIRRDYESVRIPGEVVWNRQDDELDVLVNPHLPGDDGFLRNGIFPIFPPMDEILAIPNDGLEENIETIQGVLDAIVMQKNTQQLLQGINYIICGSLYVGIIMIGLFILVGLK